MLSRRLLVEPLEDRRMLAVITVTSLADNLISDGGVTLREAIQAANTDTSVDGSVAGSGADTILFDATLSGDTITLDGTELEITEALTVDATALADNVTIEANELSRIFNITATSGDFTLAGLNLTGGRVVGDNANPSDTTFSGGAVRSRTVGNLTIDQSTISESGTMGNIASGGGIHSFGAVTFTSSIVGGNSTYGSGAGGGGVFSNGDVTLTGSTVSGNTTVGASAYGGGIRSPGDVTLTSSTVSGNSTTGLRAEGGGIFSSSVVTLTSSTVSGNIATRGGGISSNGDVTLTSSTVSGNRSADGSGGGIRSRGAVTLTSSTITDNHANDFATGGGIWNRNDAITIINSIVASNTAGGGSPDIVHGTGVFNVNFSLLGTAVTPDTGGIGNLFNDAPLLGPLADNGGPTLTHALLLGSPAIDAGDTMSELIPNFDQRGFAFERLIGPRIDIGAFEAGATSADFDIDGDIDGADFLVWQRGLGNLTAFPADGDANIDGTVNATDLFLWDATFGKAEKPIVSSADFDIDNDIDGADFLAWQRGFGILAPNANSSDGDADNDDDVDADDLVIWSSQFSQPAPVAAVTAPQASEPVAASNLIDAVMAITLVRDAQVAETPAFDDEPAFAENFSGHAFTAEAIAQAVIADESEPLDSRSSDIAAAEAPWLADELLERVFG